MPETTETTTTTATNGNLLELLFAPEPVPPEPVPPEPEPEEEEEETCDNCNRALNDCTCSLCNACGDRVDELASCDMPHCADCCDCLWCEGCERYFARNYTHFCESCGCCESCCNCLDEDDSDDFFTSGHPPLAFHTATRKEHKRNALPRHLAVEIECYGADDRHDIRDAANQWHDAIVPDGSLPDGGFELNLQPSSGDLYLEHVNDICATLRRCGARVNNSCGVHVHVDARDLGWYELWKLTRIYRRVEDALFSLVASRRRTGSYSMPCAAAYNFPVWRTFRVDLLCQLYGMRFPVGKHACGQDYVNVNSRRGGKKLRVYGEKYHHARYHALNLHSFFHRRTVEFRHHHGSTRADRISNWGMVCGWIIEAAATYSEAQIKALPQDPMQALQSMLPPDLAAWCAARALELCGS